MALYKLLDIIIIFKNTFIHLMVAIRSIHINYGKFWRKVSFVMSNFREIRRTFKMQKQIDIYILILLKKKIQKKKLNIIF